MSDEDYHRGPNPFCELSIGMVSQFPIDCMHLVCLGVIKRFILLWISESKNWKKSTTKYIRFLANFKKIYTNEICQKTKSNCRCQLMESHRVQTVSPVYWSSLFYAVKLLMNCTKTFYYFLLIFAF